MRYKIFILIFLAFFTSKIWAKEAKFYANGNPKIPSFALTYDDGPGIITDRLLDLLKSYNVKATFFLLGENVKRYPDKVRRIYSEGHLIGNHTYSHKNFFSIDKKPDKFEIFQREVLETEKLITHLGLPKPVYLRMPNGFSKKWVRELAGKMGYTLVNWSYGSDWHKMPEDKMTQEYLKALKPGAILLMHDGGKDKEKVLRITEEILKEAKKRNLKPVRLDELLKTEYHR